MADSILSLGSTPLYFPLVPNWAKIPKVNVGISRDYVSFAGTAHILGATTDLVPNEFSLSFMIDNKTDEYEFLEFYHTVKGKAYRFWVEHPAVAFHLKEQAVSGASSIVCYPNGFEKVGQDNERIFLAMKTGDLIVRKVTESAYDPATEELSLTLLNQLDREINPGDHWLIGRFLLCRFSLDNMKQSIETKNITTYSLKFTELPYEYDEQEAS